MVENSNKTYQSFLLRCWHVQSTLDNGTAGWRFALRSVSAESEDRHFSDLEQVMRFIATKFVAVGEQKIG
ncbi:MAG TPA: hypothetical protein ENJ56_06465 [Anaerolineae bacterium]|nr:hypothetical protein [Anaerolineae bacterium]